MLRVVSGPFLLLLLFVPVAIFCLMSYFEYQRARTPITFLQYGSGYRSPSFFATLLASNSSLSGALFLIAFYGLLYGPPIFVWVFIFWFSTQVMSYYTINWVNSVDPAFIANRGTLHEFISLIFGKDQPVRVTAARISLFCYVGLLASETALCYGIISSLIPTGTHLVGRLALEPITATLALLGLVAGYTSLSGFRGVVRTDALQLVLVIIMMGAIAWALRSYTLVAAVLLLSLVGLGAIFFLRPRNKPQAPPVPVSTALRELTFLDIIRDLPRQWRALLTFLLVVVIWLVASLELKYPIELSAIVNPTTDPLSRFFVFFVIANVVFWLVWWPAAMDQWHRCAASKDSSVSQHPILGTLGVAPVLYLGLLSAVFLFLGAFVKNAWVQAATHSLLSLGYCVALLRVAKVVWCYCLLWS